jgi:hypothetical protein
VQLLKGVQHDVMTFATLAEIQRKSAIGFLESQGGTTWTALQIGKMQLNGRDPREQPLVYRRARLEVLLKRAKMQFDPIQRGLS